MRIFCFLCWIFAMSISVGGAVTADEKLLAEVHQRLKVVKNPLSSSTYLHLCKCSIDHGCHGHTDGYIGNLFHDYYPEAELQQWKDICFTDGSCYQSMANEPDSQRGFGCIDKRHINDAWSSAHQSSSFCRNQTHEAWICCDHGNFCANSTLLSVYVPESHPENTFRIWIFVVIAIAVSIALLLCILYRYNNLSKLIVFLEKSWPVQRIFAQKAKPCVVDDEENAVSMSTILESATSGMRVTIEGTGCSTEEEILKCVGIHQSLYNDLLTDSGSGFGESVMAERTLGMQVELVQQVGSGRFGCVYIGMWKYEEVAVKVFRTSDEYSFLREAGIYSTAMLRHPNIIRMIGSDRVDEGFETQLWLIMEYHSYGSLYDYLSHDTVSLEQACTIMRSTATGVAFLHTEIFGMRTGSMVTEDKPAIAHRDLKSRNVMLKSDFSCAIGDLGLAVTFDSTTGKLDTGSPSHRCGTVRYLAPEILSMHLQETLFDAFRMADIYALGLVFWEVLQRTTTPEVEASSADDMLPYTGLVGRDPTIEEMTEVVYTRQQRPKIQERWKGHRPFEAFFEVLNLCWQQNPTARYTAIQVRMRLEKLIKEFIGEPITGRRPVENRAPKQPEKSFLKRLQHEFLKSNHD